MAVSDIIHHKSEAFGQAIEDFLDGLEKDDVKNPFQKEILVAKNGGKAEACAKELFSFVDKLASQRRDGRAMRIMTRLSPFITSLLSLMKACEVLLNSGPFEAGVVFVGARVVLDLAQKVHNAFEMIVSAMEGIAVKLKCYDIIADTFRSSTDIQEQLVKSYKNIVNFWQHATNLLCKKTYKTLLKSIVKPLDADIQKCLNGLNSDYENVQRLAAATEYQRNLERQRKDEKFREDQLKRDMAHWIKGGEDDTKLDVRSDLNTYLSMQHPGTCAWLFQDIDFKAWLQSNSNSTLWYGAPPGCGKTISSSAVINHLRSQGKTVVFFFYSFSDPTRSKAMSAFRSLALQLLTIVETIPDTAKKLYRQEIDNWSFSLPSQNHLTAVTLVLELLKRCKRVHVVIDGLDECKDQEVLLVILEKLVKAETYGICKWFLASRTEGKIPSTMAQLGAVPIQPPPETLNGDIGLFMGDKLRDLEKCSTCVQKWTRQSGGSFLYARWMLGTLSGQGLTCDEDIEEELNKFPVGLLGAYVRSLETLARRSTQEQELARRIIMALVISIQPITLYELLDVLAVRLGEDFSKGRVIRREELIEDLLGPFIYFDRSSNKDNPVLRLSHKSVQDLFQQDPESLDIDKSVWKFFVKEKAAHVEMGRYCLTYLQYTRYEKSADLDKIFDAGTSKEHAFLKYASAFWFQHLNHSHSPELFTEVKKFLQSRAFWTCIEVQSRFLPHLFSRYSSESPFNYVMELRGSRWDADDAIGFPMVLWLEEYGPEGTELARAFYDFLREWHEVLASHPDGLDKCLLIPTAKKLFKGRKGLECKKVNLEVKDPAGLLGSLDEEIVASGRPLKTEEFADILLGQGKPSEFKPEEWRQVTVSRHPGLGWFAAHITKMEPLTRKEAERQKTSDSGYGSGGDDSSDSGSDSEDDSDDDSDADSGVGSMDDSSDDDKSAKKKKEEGGEVEMSNALLFRDPSDAKRISKVFWGGDFSQRLQISPVFHPQGKMLVYSRRPHHLTLAMVDWCKMNETSPLPRGRVIETSMPEPIDIPQQPAGLVRDFHLSADAKILYSLMATFVSIENITTCKLSLASYYFEPEPLPEDKDKYEGVEGRKKEWVRLCCPIEEVTYQFQEVFGNIPQPFLLSHWTDKAVVVALPTLSCSPKVVRFGLFDANSPEDDPAGPETLANPVFFPSSTPRRRPQLLFVEAAEAAKGKDCLILSLDTEHKAGGKKDKRDPNSGMPPCALVYKISHSNGWRKWDAEKDEKSEELARGLSRREMLRGSFVDAEKRFNVPIRSGLDWTRKGFLSCN